jgi:serine protease inhibitor
VERIFNATIKPIHRADINMFIEKATKGKFRDLVSADDLQGCLLMLITCLYFKAKWADPFSAHATISEAPFHPFTSRPQVCPMMQKTGRMQYMEDPKMQICVLPYKADDPNTSRPCWKAAIVLPEDHGYSAMKDLLSNNLYPPDPPQLAKYMRAKTRS